MADPGVPTPSYACAELKRVRAHRHARTHGRLKAVEPTAAAMFVQPGARPALKRGVASQLLAGQDRLAFVCNASRRLAQNSESASLTQALVDLVVPEIGDGAIVQLLDRDGRTTAGSAESASTRSREWWQWLRKSIDSNVSQAERLAAPLQGSVGCGHRTSDCLCGDVGYLAVPLQVQEDTLGTLTVFRLGDRPCFAPEDVAAVEALANYAALALDNARLLEAVRDERQRIARELHDNLEQTFFAIGLAATAELRNGHQDRSEIQIPEQLARVRDLSAIGAEQLRSAIFGLNYPDFAADGLISSLWSLVTSFKQRTGIETDFVLTGPVCHEPADVAEALYATARAALNNVERHAQAGAVVLQLHAAARSISLTVRDDGRGASSLVLKHIASSAAHFGLRGLRERVRRLRGTFVCGPGPSGGFLVRVRIPLPDGRNA